MTFGVRLSQRGLPGCEALNNRINKRKQEFYVGHQGQFDSMVYSVLKAKYPQIRYTVVLACMPDEHVKELYGEDTFYPDGLETVPKQFAISKRNDWMIRKSGYAVCYVHKIIGGAAEAYSDLSRHYTRIPEPYKKDNERRIIQTVGKT